MTHQVQVGDVYHIYQKSADRLLRYRKTWVAKVHKTGRVVLHESTKQYNVMSNGELLATGEYGHLYRERVIPANPENNSWLEFLRLRSRATLVQEYIVNKLDGHDSHSLRATPEQLARIVAILNNEEYNND